jgi:peroxiredoxin
MPPILPALAEERRDRSNGTLQPLVEDWDLIPGARGCTPESCAFRDHHAELARAGADVVGLSTQDSAYQREVVERLHLPFAIVGHVLLKRFTLVIGAGCVEQVFYPVFPPDRHAQEVLRWLGAHPIEDRLP